MKVGSQVIFILFFPFHRGLSPSVVGPKVMEVVATGHRYLTERLLVTKEGLRRESREGEHVDDKQGPGTLTSGVVTDTVRKEQSRLSAIRHTSA